MKKKLLNNLGLKLLSIVCAIILWIVVMNISDGQITVRVDDIPVEKLNADSLEELDKIYDVVKGDTVDIVVKGKRSVVEKLTASDFKATADFKTMSITNTVQIFVEPNSKTVAENASITVVDNSMVLSLEEKVSVQLPIKIKTVGTPKEGYALGDSTTTPNIITISGPESVVSRIVDACVEIDVTEKSSRVESHSDIKLYDAYGQEIINDRIELASESVDVVYNIYPEKEIPVTVNIKGTPGEGYGIAVINYQPQTIRVAGSPENLEKITGITINDISISGMTETYECTVNLNNYIPEGIYLDQGNNDIVVSVVIEKLIDKNITVSDKDITLKNKDSRYDYDIRLSEGFSITVSGIEEAVNDIELSAILPYIDCANLNEGENHGVLVQTTNIEGVLIKISGVVKVTVKEK